VLVPLVEVVWEWSEGPGLVPAETFHYHKVRGVR
jgi:hypothetical protein